MIVSQEHQEQGEEEQVEEREDKEEEQVEEREDKRRKRKRRTEESIAEIKAMESEPPEVVPSATFKTDELHFPQDRISIETKGRRKGWEDRTGKVLT